MHLVILTQYYPPEIGAPQARLSELARRFAARGHAVTILTAMPNYPTGRVQAGFGGLLLREQHEGVAVIRTFIYPTSDPGFARRLLNYFSFVLSSAMFGALLLRRPDVIMVESPPLFLGLSGYWLSRLKRARLVFNISDLWPDTVVRLGVLREGSLAHRVSSWIERFCIRKAWLVTGQSRGILEDIRRRFPKVRQHLISNGVDPALFGHSAPSPDRRREMGDGRACLAVYAGLHGLAQGLEQLLEAAAQLRDVEGLALAFVGEGPTKEDLQRRARELSLDNVRFLPAVPRDQMAELVASSDVMMATLKLHLPGAVPSKIYEAMGGGVPLLLVAEGEPAEIVERTRAGVVVRPGNPAAIAAALRRLAADPVLRSQLGSNGRAAAETEFNRDHIVARFIDYLEDNIEASNAAGRAC